MNLSNILAKQLRKPHGILGHFMSKRFNRNNSRQNDWVLSISNLQPTDHVLEIGFGNGETIQKISKITASGLTEGIDHSDVMLKKAKQINKEKIKNKLVNLQLGQIPPLPYTKNSFDKIFAIYVFNFWDKPLKVFEEMHRTLKINGTAIVYLSTKETMDKLSFAQTKIFKNLDETKIKNMFKKTDFKSIQIFKKKFSKDEEGVCFIATK